MLSYSQRVLLDCFHLTQFTLPQLLLSGQQIMLKRQRYLWIIALLCQFSIATADIFEEALESYENKNYGVAYGIWETLAGEGVKNAQYYLGVLYSNGWGTKKNVTAAIKSYRMAAEQGHIEAQYTLATYLTNGVGVGKDAIEAFRWFLASAKAGLAASQFALGRIYYEGDGVKQDVQKSAEWYQKAAEQHHTFSMFNLANMYLYGEGVEKNVDEAMILYKRAADKGNLLATKRAVSLEKYKACYTTATTLVFEVLLRCTTRSELRSVIHSLNLPSISESNKRHYDMYDSTLFLNESTTLSIGYTKEQLFAHAKYEFPSSKDRDKSTNSGENTLISSLLISIETKYGTPDSATGRAGRTAVEYSWQLSDQIILELKQDSLFTSAYLEYKHPENYDKLKQTLNPQVRKLRSKVFKF